jgi:Flp pilus assembly protein TadG
MNDYTADKRCGVTKSLCSSLTSKGQALVEFTLVFILLLVILWIPADFGLAFLTGQLAQSAAREGARIASAEPNYAAQVGTCTIPACYSLTPNDNILRQTALRVSSALLTNAQVTLASDTSAGACMTKVRVTVQGTYTFFFYRLLTFMGIVGVNTNPTQITRVTAMRWEHQC